MGPRCRFIRQPGASGATRRFDNEECNEMGTKQPDGAAGPQGGDATQGRQQGQDNVHGEGNYAASRDYNERTKRFIESGQVEQAARDAAPDSESEALQMAAAEAEGKRHAKEEDPALSRKSQPANRGAEDTSTPKPGEGE
jgi:hypothetical protein